MRLNLPSLLLAGVLSLAAGLPLRADHETTASDLIRMRKGGLREGTILEFLHTYRARVILTGRGIADLAEAGFREEFIQDLIAYTRTQPPEEPPRAYDREDPPPPAEPAYATTFYVGYAFDAWAFPGWYYSGHYHGSHYWSGYYAGRGWGHSRSVGHGWGNRGTSHWGGNGGGHNGGHGGGHGHR